MKILVFWSDGWGRLEAARAEDTTKANGIVCAMEVPSAKEKLVVLL